MRANFSAEYFAFFTIFAQNPVACAELPHSCLPLDSSAFQPITPRFPSMQKRSPPHMKRTIISIVQRKRGEIGPAPGCRMSRLLQRPAAKHHCISRHEPVTLTNSV